MNRNQQQASDFFDEIVGQYDVAIKRCVPRYDEMLDLMLEYVWNDSPKRILELGCGSGNLTERILKKFPNAKLTAVDASGRMIDIARHRFSEWRELEFKQAAFQQLAFPKDTYDLIVSSISIHHLNDEEKLALFQHARDWLSPNGIFTFCDQFAGESPYLYSRHMEFWHSASKAMGATEQEWEDWMSHQEAHDFHSSIQLHFDLLSQAGFKMIDCTRRYFLWTTLIASGQADD